MKTNIQILLLMMCCCSLFGQITFNGCHDLFEDQDYIFSYIETDATGRNVYTTIPVDGEQSCGGVGTCEFRIQWNDADSVWEFTADDGNGDFGSPYVIYTNTVASSPNPPSLILGTWVENSSITDSGCGGNLSPSNAVLTGNVQDEELSMADSAVADMVRVYPVPAKHSIQIKTTVNIDSLVLFDVFGKAVVRKFSAIDNLDVSGLKSGVYFLKIETSQGNVLKKITVK